MTILDIQITPWDKIYKYTLNKDEPVPVEAGDYVVIDLDEDAALGQTEIGKVIEKKEMSKERILQTGVENLRAITRKATQEDIETALNYKKQKEKASVDCKALIKKHDLPIKLVDVHFSFDGEKVIFAFIADGRVDFRELLKDLNKIFRKNIRLQQLGIRDEMKMSGDIGPCGRGLCCRSFHKDLGNVTSDLAELQQVSHRGSERLSGVCGRLKCCLTYEQEHYEKMAEKLPMIGDKINTEHGKGEVIGWHVLKQSVDVLLDDKETIVEVPLKK